MTTMMMGVHDDVCNWLSGGVCDCVSVCVCVFVLFLDHRPSLML